jgi:O-antigen/teichoic acid export membrane protein
MTASAIGLVRVRTARGAARISRSSGTWVLSVAMVASGILTYAFHVLAARTLGADAYGQIAVLWGAMFLVAIVVFRPIEQTTSRAVADRLARGEEVRSVTRAAGSMAALLLIAIGVAAVLGWHTISSRLFLGDNWMTGLLVAGVVAYGLSYVVRGLLGGTRWFAGYSVGLMADGVVRLAVALPLLAYASRFVAGAAVVAAGLAGALVPVLVGRRRLAAVGRGGPGVPFRLREGLRFAAPASVIAWVDQLLVNGGPLLVIAAGGARATHSAGVVFAATMLVRAPVYVFQGLAAALLPNFTHMQARESSRRLGSAVAQTVAFMLAGGVVIAAAMAAAGPESMRFLYGGDFAASRVGLICLGAGVGLYLAASTISQALLALDRGAGAALGWAAAGIAFVTAYAVVPGGNLTRVGIAFALGAGLCMIVLAVQLRRGVGR